LSSDIASNSAKSLAILQVKTIHKIQRAFGDDAMSISRIKEWFNRFKDGRTSVDMGTPNSMRILLNASLVTKS
jgi:hypothetical protein